MTIQLASATRSVIAPLQRIGRPPLTYGHGAGNTPLELLGAVLPSIRPMMTELTRDGWNVGCWEHAQDWANPADDTANDTTATWLIDTYGSVAGKRVAVGGSMGACSQVGYASRYPENVACVVGFIPALDLDWLRDNDFSGAAAVIEAAWGIGPSDPLPTGANPVTVAPVVPQMHLYSSDDAFTVGEPGNPSRFLEWAAQYDDLIEVVDLGPLGHSDAAIQAVDVAAVREFIREHTP